VAVFGQEREHAAGRDQVTDQRVGVQQLRIRLTGALHPEHSPSQLLARLGEPTGYSAHS
jgi:hypothetical protein